MSEATATVTPAREELLLQAMADQQSEFNAFRENTSSRLARLEKSRRSLLDVDPETLFERAVMAALIFLAIRFALFLFVQFKNAGGNRGYVPMPQA